MIADRLFMTPAHLRRQDWLQRELWFLAVLAVVILAADTRIQLLNSAVFLPVVVFIALCQFSGRHVKAILVVALTICYLSAILNMATYPHLATPQILGYRAINRTAIALAILLIEMVYRQYRVAHDPPSDEFDRLVRTLIRQVAPLLSFVLVAALWTIDLFVPNNLDISILYCLPLSIVALTRSQKLLWVFLIVSSVCTLTGFIFGPPAAGQLAPLLWRNRVMVICSMFALILLISIQKNRIRTATDFAI